MAFTDAIFLPAKETDDRRQSSEPVDDSPLLLAVERLTAVVAALEFDRLDAAELRRLSAAIDALATVVVEPPQVTVQAPVAPPVDLSVFAAALAPLAAIPEQTVAIRAAVDELTALRKKINSVARGGGGGGGGANEVGLRTGSEMAPVSADNALHVRDDFRRSEILEDQVGAGGVLTFTFAAPMDFMWVTDVGATATNISRVDPFGGIPTATLGVAVFNQASVPISIVPANATVKVFTPTGSTIAIFGFGRT